MSVKSISRRGFFQLTAGAGALALTGCAGYQDGSLDGAQSLATTNTYQYFHDRVHARKLELEREYQDLDARAYYGSSGSRIFDDLTQTSLYEAFEEHVSNPNIDNYMEDILRGYNQSRLLYTANHVETQALAETAAKYMNHPNDRVRSAAAHHMAGAFAFAYKDVFGNQLQKVMQEGNLNTNELIQVCGKYAPDGLAWAYKTLVHFAPIVTQARHNITDMCSLTCPQGRVIQPVGSLNGQVTTRPRHHHRPGTPKYYR